MPDLSALDQAVMANLAPRPRTVEDLLSLIDLTALVYDDGKPIPDPERRVRDHLRNLEDSRLVRRSDERPNGAHVWQLTKDGRKAIGLE